LVPERAPLLQIAAVFAGFPLGPLGGLGLAMLLTPNSDLVQSLSVFALAGVFATGLLVRMGLGIVAVVAGAVVWTLAGLAHGWSGWWAAHAGYLPFPEPE
jgi:hypothetical protein